MILLSQNFRFQFQRLDQNKALAVELGITNILEHLLSKLVTEQVVDHAQEMLGFASRQALLHRLRNLMLQF